MNPKHCTILFVALLALALLRPYTARAEVLSSHSPDFQRMKATMDELAQKSGQDFEVAYINSIIPHHQDAIAMARTVQNDAPHKEVRDAAMKIINDQQKEIDDLTSWLKDWYGQSVSPDSRMQMSQSMMDMLKQAEPTMRDQLFLAMMREHHQTALMMGPMVIQKATHEELKRQAQQMIASQKQEQDMFGGWLQALYGMMPPTPTGDMQDGMDAVMKMTAPAAAPTTAPAAPSAGSGGPQELPRTGGENDHSWPVLIFSILALVGGAYLLRRATA